MDDKSELVRAHVWVKGRVQGVGFRAHVEYSARQVGGITGWVRNVGYDTVEAVAEGTPAQIERFLHLVEGWRYAGFLNPLIDEAQQLVERTCPVWAVVSWRQHDECPGPIRHDLHPPCLLAGCRRKADQREVGYAVHTL